VHPYTRSPSTIPAGPPQQWLMSNDPGTSPSSTIGCIQPISRSITTPASTVGIEEKANPWNAGGNSKVDQKK
jgi:hypothetical protein